MIASFVIFLREGVEASMIVAILLSYLNRTGRRDLFRDIFIGVAAALALAAVAGVAIYATVRTYAGTRTQTIFETITFLFATAVLTYMTFWMRSHGRTMSAELKDRVDSAIGASTATEAGTATEGAALLGSVGVSEVDPRARWGLALLAFQAVGREGLETVVFTLAIAFSSTGAQVLGGGSAGLVVALGIAFGVYRLGRRLDVNRFFRAVGALLMVFAAGLLVDAVENLQQLGWLPVLTHGLWNTGSVLSEGSTLGDILHTFFGYAQSPSVLQVVVYFVYVAVVMTAFFGVRLPAARRAASIRSK